MTQKPHPYQPDAINKLAAKHGDLFQCPTCGNSKSRLDIDTPENHPLPEGEWCWWNHRSEIYECSECYLK
jgi:hypothetical protein